MSSVVYGAAVALAAGVVKSCPNGRQFGKAGVEDLYSGTSGPLPARQVTGTDKNAKDHVEATNPAACACWSAW
jgi:L-lactate utilization protein LutB